jgi:ADP-heptose:LPS heptosyltransferase
MDKWEGCKNILCIRADNMGDVLMSSPAIAALKETFGCRITLLTSSMGAVVGPMIPEIDEVITADLPWVKLQGGSDPELLLQLTAKLRKRQFDGCVIFTVYSQSSLPAALMAFMSGIPRCLAYCRENPYHLVSNWLPDEEPYSFIVHQVERDLALVQSIGAGTENLSLRVALSKSVSNAMQNKLVNLKVQTAEGFVILHAGVSEDKRKYPGHLWIEIGKLIRDEMGLKLILTGSLSERHEIEMIRSEIGPGAYNTCGDFSLEEFAGLIKASISVISVNTGTVHLAAALKKPLVVLYARTNPQHIPWMVPHRILDYSIPRGAASKNRVISYVNGRYYREEVPFPTPRQVVDALKDLLLNTGNKSLNAAFGGS